MKITGFVETYLTDKNGVKRKVGEQHNDIGGNFFKALAQYLDEYISVKYLQLTPLFTGGTGYTDSQENKSGIACDIQYGGSLQAAFATVLSQPSANQLRATGTWTNPEVSTKTLQNAIIGRNWIKDEGWEHEGDGGHFYSFDLAEGGMADTDVPSGELIYDCLDYNLYCTLKRNNMKQTKRNDSVGIFGHIKVFITRANGIKELVFEDKNAIQAAYANAIVDALDAGTNYTMDNLFNGNANPPPNGEDGIAIKDSGGLWYEMIMATPVVTSSVSGTPYGNVLFVGTFTGVGITVADANSVNLGHNYAAPFNTIIAKPSSWASQAVLNTETLTIEWTIKHQTT